MPTQKLFEPIHFGNLLGTTMREAMMGGGTTLSMTVKLDDITSIAGFAVLRS
jgi:hypothetical protein